MRALAILVATVAAVLPVAAPSEVRAGGLEGGDHCVTRNPGSGATAIKSTIAAEADVSSGEIRVTLRLERGGVLYFDRIALVLPAGIPIPNTHVDFICLWLPHEDNEFADIPALGDRILGAFGLPTDRNLCLTDKSISKAEALSPLPTIPGTTTVATMVDADIYAVNGACTP